jgi:hypothetical protein
MLHAWVVFVQHVEMQLVSTIIRCTKGAYKQAASVDVCACVEWSNWSGGGERGR